MPGLAAIGNNIEKLFAKGAVLIRQHVIWDIKKASVSGIS